MAFSVLSLGLVTYAFLVRNICAWHEKMFFGPSVLLLNCGIVIDDVWVACLVTYFAHL